MAQQLKWMFAHLQVLDSKLFLEDVRGVGATSQRAHRRQVPAVPALRLDDEHPRFRAGRRLLDAIADL